MSTTNAAVAILIGCSSAVLAQEQEKQPVPSVAEIRRTLLTRNDFRGPADQQAGNPDDRLLLLGDRIFPAYLTILNDQAVTNREAARIFALLQRVHGDRSQFVPYVIKWLGVPDANARRWALRLLGQIGNLRDLPPLVALLGDNDLSISFAAMEAIAALGGDRELVVLDVWGRAHANSILTNAKFREPFEQSRAALQRRVDEERKKSGGGVAVPAVPQRDDHSLSSARDVRAALNERTQYPWPKLTSFGDRLFPVLEAILNDPTLPAAEAANVFTLLQFMKGDRQRFVDHAVRWLAAPQSNPRMSAIGLLSEIGSRQDTPAIVAQLWDQDINIVQAALAALNALGGERELLAIDIWIKAKADEFRAAEQARDAMRKRVEEEKKKAGGS